VARIHNVDADGLLDRKFPVLDHGFVQMIDYMGGDKRIVDAARVSTKKNSKGRESDRKLINYLMSKRHTSPFEQVVLTFNIKMPIFVARQMIRHRTARLNEVSGRYSVLSCDSYVPNNRMQYQSQDNMQGSGSDMPEDIGGTILEQMIMDQTILNDSYDKYLGMGLSREVARINLPLSTYTEWFWQIDLHNLFHFLNQRLDEDAQWEIRQYAEVIGKCAEAVAPVSYDAFLEYVLHAKSVSRSNIMELREILRPDVWDKVEKLIS